MLSADAVGMLLKIKQYISNNYLKISSNYGPLLMKKKYEPIPYVAEAFSALDLYLGVLGTWPTEST